MLPALKSVILGDPRVYHNKEDKEITQREWERLREDEEYKYVERDIVGLQYLCTVWNGERTPTQDYFETALFDLPKDFYSSRDVFASIKWKKFEVVKRVSSPTLESAKKTHDAMLKSMKNTYGTPFFAK